MPNKTAVFINGNARSVGRAEIETLKNIIPKDSLFVSQSLKHSRQIAQEAVQQKFDIIFCGGGDGTFSQIASDIFKLKPKKMPAFGILRLGTGNGLAEVLGVPPFSVKNLHAGLRQAENPNARIKNFSLLRIEDRIAPFAGVGLDGHIMGDYDFVKKTLNKMPILRTRWRGPIDYALAVTTLSFWRYLRDSFMLPELLIRNGNAGKAQYINRWGQPVGKPVEKGAKIFEDPICIAFISTIPCIGWGLRVFPQTSIANKPLKLRIVALSVSEFLMQLPTVVMGTTDHEGVNDYACQELIFETKNPNGIPFEIAGDPVGRKKKVVIGLERVTMISGPDGLAPDLPK